MQINGNLAQIGDVGLNAHVLELSPDNEYRYVIEATADEHRRVGQYFPLHELRKLRPSDLPNDFYLAVDGVNSQRAQFRNLDYLNLTKKSDKTTLSVVIHLGYWDWHIPENLHHFAARYVQSLAKSAQPSMTAHYDRDEVGVLISISAIAPADQNLYETFQQIEACALAAYRSTLAEGYTTPALADSSISTSSKSPEPTGDAHGLRWWVRYVIVPILGGGTFAAVIAGMFGLLKR